MNYPRIPEEEIVPRGEEIYEGVVRPELRPEDEGKFVAVDVVGGGYAVEADEEEAFAKASERADPGSLFFFVRVGPDGAPIPAHRIGGF